MDEIMMTSPTHGLVNLDEIVTYIIEYVKSEPNAEYEVAIGTDSQNFDKTKIVLTLVARKMGHGGIFFYKIDYLPLIRNIREKLTKETHMSLELADKFMSLLEQRFDTEGFDYAEYKIHYQVHVDAGYNGKTTELIPELTSWVRACGYDVSIKPESFAASSIANKYSK